MNSKGASVGAEPSSAWAEAVSIGALRDSLAARGLEATVRAVARESGISSGKVGDLLKVRDAFPDHAVLLIGDGYGGESGTDRLSRSFAQLEHR